MSEVGVSGISRQGGIIADEILPELTGPKRTRIIRQMLSNDATIGALLFAVKMLVRQVEWRVDPAADNAEDKDAADFISGALFDDMSHSWSDTALRHRLVPAVGLGLPRDRLQVSRRRERRPLAPLQASRTARSAGGSGRSARRRRSGSGSSTRTAASAP
jgi:hypothetical protein